jgi:Tfp pilus assembly protein FimV
MIKSSFHPAVCTAHGILSPKWLASALLLSALAAAQAVAQVPNQTATQPATQATPPALFPPNMAPAPKAGAAAAPARPAVVASGRTYKVLRGESLDKVIQKTMADSPLRIELLRNAFIELNPQAFPGGQASRMRSTDELKVPDAVQLLRAVATPLLETEDTSRAAAPAAAEQQRRWVRFP